MMRKVNLVGVSTLTISLPAKWVQERGIQKGDELKLIQEGNCLQISTENNQERTANVDFTAYNDHVIRLVLNNLYREGYDTINLDANPHQISLIKKICESSLPGFEVSETTDSKCVLKNILKVDDANYPVIYRRIFLIIGEMMRDEICQIGEDDCTCENIELHFNKIEQYVNYCLRDLIVNNDKKLFVESYSLTNLLILGATLRRLYRFIIANKVASVPADIHKVFSKIETSFHNAYEAIFKKDIKALAKCDAEFSEIFEKDLFSLHGSKSKNNEVIIDYLGQVVRCIITFLSPATIITLENLGCDISNDEL